MYVQVIECIDCPYEVISQNLSTDKYLNLTFNTKYKYHMRIEFNNTTFCLVTLILHEHGQYILNVQTSSSSTTNSSSNTNLTCLLTTRRSPNNAYIPLIIGGLILLILFIVCIVFQRLKLYKQLIKLKQHCFKHIPSQESAHSYDLQVRSSETTNDQINNTNRNSTQVKLPPIQKISHTIVPKSKRLLSLDAFRGFGKRINMNTKRMKKKKRFKYFFIFSFNSNDICQLWWWWLCTI